MKYYVLEISEGDSKIAGKAVYEYTTLKEAEANFHQKLATAMKSDLYTSELAEVIDSNGGLHMMRKYEAETSETEEETTVNN